MSSGVRLNIRLIIGIITGILLAFYIVSTTAFEGNPSTGQIASIALYAFLAFGCLNILIKREIKLNYYIIAMWAYGFLLLATFMLNNSDIAIQTLYWYFTCTIITTIVINFLENEDRIHLILKAYVLAGVVLCIIAFGYYGLNIFESAANSIYGIRVGGEFGNANSIGMACAWSVIIALYFLLYQNNKLIMKNLFLFSIIICLLFALLTASKKALILIFLGVLLLFFLKRDGKRAILSSLSYMVLGIVAIFALYKITQTTDAFWYVKQRMFEMFQTLFGNSISATDQIRLYMIERGLLAFSERPFFGNGVAYSFELFGTYSHNNFVEILINTGIIGFIIYYSSYVVSFRQLFLGYKDKEMWVIMLIIIGVISILELGMVDYYSRYFQILLATVSAYASLKHKVVISWNTKRYVDGVHIKKDGIKAS